jgi:hypothetical protein
MLVDDELRRRFHDDPRVAGQLPGLRQAVLSGEVTPVQAATTLLATHQTPPSPTIL